MRLKYVLFIVAGVIWMAGIRLVGGWERFREDLFNGEVLFSAGTGLAIGVATVGPHLFFLHKRARRYLKEFPQARVEELHSTKLAQELVVLRSPAETFKLCRAAIQTLNGTWITEEDPETGYIKARRGLSWTSWGERLEFHITPIGARYTELKVCSRPVLYSNFLDSGRNVGNITSICSYLRDQTKAVHMQALVAA